MITVRQLTEVLQKQENQDAEIVIVESQHDWHNVLLVINRPDSPDSEENTEIHVGG